ncbi:MAG: alpha/beta fold hydrolase [Gemmatimonadaceae bacterium]
MLTALFVASMAAGSALPAPADSVASQPITLKTPTGDLFGSLVVPPGGGKHPVVLIIAGSGPTDRDGNSPIQVVPGKLLHPDTYKILAADLAADGIASVRYDKRGVAASAGAMAGHTESDYRFDTGINDAAAWIKLLRADPRFSKVVVVGHSEGSLVGMDAAEREKADGFVSLEGAGRPAAVVIREQLTAGGAPAAIFGPILDSLSTGKTVDSIPPSLAALFRPSVQPYLISWFRHDPAADLKKLPYATLIVQGTHDIQVSMDDANLLAAAPGAKLLKIDGMTHVLKIGPADATAQVAGVYTDPSVPIPPELISAIAAYVRSAPQSR